MKDITNALSSLQKARQYLIAILKDRGFKVSDNATLAELQEIVDRLNNGEAVLLPTLENPATEANIIANYEAIDGQGEKITGTHEIIEGAIEHSDFMMIPDTIYPGVSGRTRSATKTAPAGKSFSNVTIDLGSTVMPYKIVKGFNFLGVEGTAEAKIDVNTAPVDSIVVGQAPQDFTIYYFAPGVVSYNPDTLTRVDFNKGNPAIFCAPQLNTPFFISAPGGITIDPAKSINIKFLHPLNLAQPQTITFAVGVAVSTTAILSIS